ncbi:MAG: undecaprenyl/decaprenyl-phosphate alpha-N-acetylglucosaminyl 1-phosphate transferase [Sedimentisphaerales bacterium]|nr:undecaprenyl/decaprenyl-phosphate alpha-N-acetylglucosaminyl 1-phosphate transferase [Sedimentisphaerales bacterium]
MIFDDFIGDKRPLTWVLQFWPVPIIAFLVGLAGTWLCKKFALHFGIVDKPDHIVKTHEKPVAYLGGVGIYAGLFAGLAVGLWQTREISGEATKWIAGIGMGGGIACVVGIIDDLFDIRPLYKLLGQALAGLTLVICGIRPALQSFPNVLGWTMSQSVELWLGIGVVFIFVLGATNSLNLLDGLDGLCAGVTGIITIAMLILAIHLSTWEFSLVGDPVRVIVCLALAGGVFGFLPFNRHPAKIFMGDAGSILLGFTIASLMILFAEKIPRWWLASIVVFGLPILDTATALVRRLLNHRPLFLSDRGHIYDQMIDRGIPLKKTVGICYLLTVIYTFIGLLMSQIQTRYAVIVYILVFAVSGFLVWKKGFLEMNGLRGAC